MPLEPLPHPLQTCIDPHQEGHRRRLTCPGEADVAAAELVTMAAAAAVLVEVDEGPVVPIEEVVEEGDTTIDLVPVVAVRPV